MKIALYGKEFQEKFLPKFTYILHYLEEKGVLFQIYHSLADFVQEKFGQDIQQYTTFTTLDNDVDMVFSIGGDGTFLSASNLVNNKDIPILGINSGRLGFLAAVAPDEIEKALEMIFRGAYSTEERTLIELVTPIGVFKDKPFALNELGVFKNDTSSMITIKAYIGDKFITTYWSDGLLVATPTGSTAYSLSAGGPIIEPSCANFVISPVSPHNLTVRPIVIPDNLEIRLEVDSRSSHFLISLDSRSELVPSGTEIVLKKADFTVKTINFADISFYKTLRNKLMWGLDIRN